MNVAINNDPTDLAPHDDTGVDLYWLPLGQGGHVVRRCGHLYEALMARREHRRARPLFHTALVVRLGRRCYVIEMAPAWGVPADERGVAVVGPVGSPLLGRLRAFRYEIRCWSGGTIPDANDAVGGPQRLSDDSDCVATLLALVPKTPALVWGRDELRAGEMWNSNSMVSWLLTEAGIETAGLVPPNGGRAPGWQAGLALAARQWAAPALEPIRGGRPLGATS